MTQDEVHDDEPKFEEDDDDLNFENADLDFVDEEFILADWEVSEEDDFLLDEGSGKRATGTDESAARVVEDASSRFRRSEQIYETETRLGVRHLLRHEFESSVAAGWTGFVFCDASDRSETPIPG